MADTKISALSNYTTPIGADIIPIVDTTNSQTKGITLATLHHEYNNFNTSAQSGFATDTYLTGSNLTVPAGGPYAGSSYHLVFDMSKTAAGTATPIVTLRYGTNGTTADTAILTFTFGAGTAAIDVGIFELWATFQTVGAGTSAVLQGNIALTSNLTTTGISNAKKAIQATSAGFNSTVANSIIGCSLNAGASAVWTGGLTRAEIIL